MFADLARPALAGRARGLLVRASESGARILIQIGSLLCAFAKPRPLGERGRIMATPYDTDLDRNPANFQPLTPLTFLERAAEVFPDHDRDHPRQALAGPMRNSMRARASSPRRSPSAASSAATRSRSMLANTPAMLEAHYGVPMAGAVLNTINTRLDAATIAFIARPRRGQGADHRPRIRQGDEGGAGALPR